MDTIGLDSYGVGKLFVSNNSTSYEFQPYEVSGKQLGLIVLNSFIYLAQNNEIYLVSNNKKIYLKLASYEAISNGKLGLIRAKFNCLDPEINFEKNLMSYDLINKMGSNGLKAIQSARFSLENPIATQARTFGSVYSYSLRIENISKSGLLLSTNKKNKAPFIVNTLLEIKFVGDDKIILDPFDCLAKVMRIESNTGKGFGVKFIELDDEIKNQLSVIVDSIELT